MFKGLYFTGFTGADAMHRRFRATDKSRSLCEGFEPKMRDAIMSRTSITKKSPNDFGLLPSDVGATFMGAGRWLATPRGRNPQRRWGIQQPALFPLPQHRAILPSAFPVHRIPCGTCPPGKSLGLPAAAPPADTGRSPCYPGGMLRERKDTDSEVAIKSKNHRAII